MNEGNGITTLAAFVPALERKAATPCRAAGSESASRNNKKARCEDSRGKTGDSASLHWPPLKPLPNESASDAKARHEACSQLTVKLQAQMETIIFRQCHLVGRSITNFVVSEFEEYQGRFLRMAVEDDGVENCKISSGQLPTGIILSDCPNQDTSLSLTSIVASLRTAGCICAHFRAREYGAGATVGALIARMLQQYTGAEKGESMSWEMLNSWYFEEGQDRDSSPLVLLIEGSEQLGASVLRDVIYLLSESRESHDLPFTLVLHASASKHDLLGLLPSVAAARLNAVAYQLPSSHHLLDCILDEVLIDPSSPLMLSQATLQALLRSFNMYEMSISAVKKTLHVALLEHFYHNPLSSLLPKLGVYFSGQGTEGTAYRDADTISKSMTKDQLDYACNLPSSKQVLGATSKLLGSDRTSKEGFVKEALRGLKCAKLSFCIGIRWVQAAIVTQHRASCGKASPEQASYTVILRSLLATKTRPAYVRALLDGVERVPSDELIALLNKWTEIVKAVSTDGFEELHQAIQLLHTKAKAGCLDTFPQKVSALLREQIDRTTTWEKVPCNEIICYSERDTLMELLHTNPRKRLLEQLTYGRPAKAEVIRAHLKDHGDCEPNRDMDDTCLAFHLLKNFGERVQLQDWYRSFCDAYSNTLPPETPSKRRRRSGKRADPRNELGKHADDDGGDRDMPANEHDDIHPTSERDHSKQSRTMRSKAVLQARFMRATNELRMFGFIKESKGKGDYVHRSIF